MGEAEDILERQGESTLRVVEEGCRDGSEGPVRKECTNTRHWGRVSENRQHACKCRVGECEVSRQNGGCNL